MTDQKYIDVRPHEDPPTQKYTNDACPITLEPLTEIGQERIFVHSGIAYDTFALYTHLATSLYFLNPVNRVPFSLEDLQCLEEKIKQLSGPDSILYNRKSDEHESDSIVSDILREDDSIISSVELHVLSTDSMEVDDTIRLQVDVHVEPSTPTPSICSRDSTIFSDMSDTNDEVDIFDMHAFDNIVEDDLPPKQCYPSIVELFLDSTRAQQLKADLDLVQYLSYDCADILQQILNLIADDNFHQSVWEQTSASVSDVVNQLIVERSEMSGNALNTSTDYNVEILYTDCWESYRTYVLRWLKRRYCQAINDMKRVSYNDADLCVKSHLDIVEGASNINPERKAWLLDILNDQ